MYCKRYYRYLKEEEEGWYQDNMYDVEKIEIHDIKVVITNFLNVIKIIFGALSTVRLVIFQGLNI